MLGMRNGGTQKVFLSTISVIIGIMRHFPKKDVKMPMVFEFSSKNITEHSKIFSSTVITKTLAWYLMFMR